MASSFENIMADLKNRIYRPVYLLMGDEPYYIDLISDFIEANILTETEKEFNQTILYGKDVKVPELISMARRYPMMANYQVIIVREAQSIDDIEAFANYAEEPVKSTILVFCYKYGKVDKRKSFPKHVEKKGVLFESARIYDSKIPDWITRYIGEIGYKITAKACMMLLEFLGNDLSKIVNEIGKLSINIPRGGTITEEFIEKYIGISKDFNVFELQKALGSKDVFKANQIIWYFAANPRDNPLQKVIPLLYSYFSKVLVYHSLADKSRNNAASALSVNPYFIGDYQVAARNYPLNRLAGVISILREYDVKSKGVDSTQSTGDGELMKEMVYRILH